MQKFGNLTMYQMIRNGENLMKFNIDRDGLFVRCLNPSAVLVHQLILRMQLDTATNLTSKYLLELCV